MVGVVPAKVITEEKNAQKEYLGKEPQITIRRG